MFLHSTWWFLPASGFFPSQRISHFDSEKFSFRLQHFIIVYDYEPTKTQHHEFHSGFKHQTDEAAALCLRLFFASAVKEKCMNRTIKSSFVRHKKLVFMAAPHIQVDENFPNIFVAVKILPEKNSSWRLTRTMWTQLVHHIESSSFLRSRHGIWAEIN